MNINLIRQQFASLEKSCIFFDNPGGTQISRRSLSRIHSYLIDSNANLGGAFRTSQASDELVMQLSAAMSESSARRWSKPWKASRG